MEESIEIISDYALHFILKCGSERRSLVCLEKQYMGSEWKRDI